MFSIIESKINKLIGACGLCYIDLINKNADFSIYIGKNNLYIDDKYAIDSANLLLEYGFTVLNLHRIWAEIYNFDKIKKKTFASRNYPDFISFKPHKIAIEYKKSSNGSVVKQTIGQCIMHTLCDEFEFVYCLFQDENKKKKILESTNNENEGMILEKLWDDYNVCMKFI